MAHERLGFPALGVNKPEPRSDLESFEYRKFSRDPMKRLP
jgi:hypothetical protein